MTTPSTLPATNERILRMLEEIKEQLAASTQREERIARDLARLIAQK
ncbi:MAG: hypothetical protein R2736_16405 [Solirubrobacterales bacterium]